MATVLKIDDVEVDRPAGRLVLDRINLSVEHGFDSAEFTEIAVRLPGSWGRRQKCELVVDGVTRFKGVIVGSWPAGMGRGPINIGYRALGLDWLANRIAITAADGSGAIVLNLPSTDDDYVPINSGLSVGAILTRLFDLHADHLAAAGIGSYSPAEMAALVVVPTEPVVLSGGLWNAVRALLAQWCNKFVAWIEPSDGSIHVKSQLDDLAPLTLTLDSDPIVVDALSRDHSECFTKVVLRGAANVQAAYLDFADGGLSKGWTSGEEAAWTPDDFYQPKDSADLGSVTAQTSTTLTVQSDDPARFWAANYWNGIVAEVVAYDTAATDITFSESRRITGCTALSAGGAAVLTVDAPFNNSGYNRYSIRGMYSQKSLVWRKVLINPDWVAKHLVKRFSHSVPWAPSDGVATQTTDPQANVCYSTGCAKPWNETWATFDVVPYDGATNGFLVFNKPLNLYWNAEPCEVKVLVPYSLGALTATAPASGFEGSAYDVDGVEQVLYRELPRWMDYRDQAAMDQLAQETLDTVKNTVCEGSITYYGKLADALAKGVALNLAAASHTTGYESMAALVRNVTLDYVPLQGGGSAWVTRLAFSNRMKPFAGDRLYVHPSYGSQQALQDAALDLRGGAGMVSAAAEASAFRPDSGYQGPMDDGELGRNTWKGPRKDTGLSAADLRGALGKDAGRNAIEADDRENRRRVAERGNQRAWTDLSGALGGLEERNVVDADDRENRRLAAQSASGRDASRLSHALGNPAGPAPKEATPEQVARHESDRAIDAELARIAGDDDGRDRNRRRGGGPGLGYE